MSNLRKRKAKSLRPRKNRTVESLESRQLMTVAMGIDASFDGLYKVDLDTGNVSDIGQLHPDADRYTTPVSMAIRPSDNSIFVINNSPAEDRGLSVVDPATGLATMVGDDGVGSIAFGPDDVMYGLKGGQLAKIDPATGAGVDLSGGDIPTLYGLDFNADDGHLYGVTGNVGGESVLLKINTDGEIVKRMPLSKNIGTVPGGMVFDGDRLVVTNISNDMYDVDPNSGDVLDSRSADRSAQGLGILTQPTRRPQGTVYGVDSSSDSIYTVNLVTGDATDIGPLHPDPARYTTPVSIAIRPNDDAIFVINNSPSKDSGLSRVDPNTGLATLIGASNVESISFGGGNTMYGVASGKLAVVDATSGATRVIGEDSLPRLFGLDYNWDDGHLYGITGNTDGKAMLLKISTDGELVDEIPLDNTIDTVPGSVVFDARGQMVVSNISRRLFNVDHTNGHLSNARSSEKLMQGLDIARGVRVTRPTGAVFAVDSASDSLYKMNLDTGEITEVGPLHADADRYTTPVSLAMRPSDDTLFVINNSPESDKGLSIVDKATGLATLVTDVEVETIAFDASDVMYGLSGGELATIDPATGDVTKLGGDAMPRLFGLDFNWDDGNLYGITGNVDGEATLLRISTAGDVLAELPLDRNIDTVPGAMVFGADGQLVITNIKGHMFDVDPATGEVSNCREADRSAQGLAVSSTVEAEPTPERLTGDINGDGEVDFADFLILSNNFGADEATHAEGDLDGDCEVGFSDFLILSENYGETLETESPPPAPGPVDLLMESRDEFLFDKLDVPTEFVWGDLFV